MRRCTGYILKPTLWEFTFNFRQTEFNRLVTGKVFNLQKIWNRLWMTLMIHLAKVFQNELSWKVPVYTNRQTQAQSISSHFHFHVCASNWSIIYSLNIRIFGIFWLQDYKKHIKYKITSMIYKHNEAQAAGVTPDYNYTYLFIFIIKSQGEKG